MKKISLAFIVYSLFFSCQLWSQFESDPIPDYSLQSWDPVSLSIEYPPIQTT
jgi:hypothetical protein